VSGSEHDPVVHRAIDELRRLPALDRDAVQRVVQAAAAARVSPADETDIVAPRRTPSVRVWSAIGLAAAAAIAGFVVGGTRLSRSDTSVEQVAIAPATVESMPRVIPVSRGAADAMPVMQQFVFDNKRAQRVSVIGDFNKWDQKAHVMTRNADGVWSIVLPIMPGRHVYGFMIDDSVFALDPRKPKALDPDLGGERSVLMIGRP
jgi:hypothetical protein